MAKSYTGNDLIIGTGADPARAAFLWIAKPRPPKASVLAVNPNAPHKFEGTFLLDPKVAAHAATIAQVKKEALELCNKAGVTPKQIKQKCWGTDEDLDKPLDGYAGMFWIKAKEETKPVIRNRNNLDVIPGEKQFPYGGCYVIGKLSLWLYTNTQIGIAANFKVIQFVKHGKAFGRPEETADEFKPLPPMADEDGDFLGGDMGAAAEDPGADDDAF